jgi:hypothetical protein
MTQRALPPLPSSRENAAMSDPRETRNTDLPRPYELPSPEQIRRRCAAIRAEWSEREHERRASVPRRPWAVPQSRVPIDDR